MMTARRSWILALAAIALLPRPAVSRAAAERVSPRDGIRWATGCACTVTPWRLADGEEPAARKLLSAVLRKLRRDPRAYDLDDAVARWREGAAPLPLRSRDGRSADLLLRACGVAREDGGPQVLLVVLWDTSGTRRLPEETRTLLRWFHERRRPTFAEIARQNRGDECEWRPEVCRAWAERFERFASRFDSSDYEWTIRESPEGCRVSLSPRTGDLPPRGIVERDRVVVPLDDWELDAGFARKDPETGRCIPGTAGGSSRTPGVRPRGEPPGGRN